MAQIWAGSGRTGRLADRGHRAAPGPGCGMRSPAAPLGESRPAHCLLEHAAPPGRRRRRVREQRGGQVVPGALGDDGVDPVVVGGGEERDPAAVGGAGDPDPRIARVVEQDPGLAGEPGDELLDVLDLVVGRVQPDLPGRGAETPARTRSARRIRPAPGPRPAGGRRPWSHRIHAPAGRLAAGRARRREEAGVEHHVLVVARPVDDGDAQVADGHGAGWPRDRGRCPPPAARPPRPRRRSGTGAVSATAHSCAGR